MRLDKFLAEVGIGSRKEVKVLIKKGQIKVNEEVIKSDKFQVKEFDDQITYLDEPLVYQKDFYYVLNNQQVSFQRLKTTMIKQLWIC